MKNSTRRMFGFVWAGTGLGASIAHWPMESIYFAILMSTIYLCSQSTPPERKEALDEWGTKD